MLKIRVIPTLLWKGYGLVKGIGFDSSRRVGPVLPAIKVYNQRDVDELVLVDITAHLSAAELDYESIDDFSSNCSIPLTVGGGIRHLDQVQSLLGSGADKVVINTFAYDDSNLIPSIAARHGSQSIVASVDVRLKKNFTGWECYSHAGQRPTGRDVVSWVKQLEDSGAGEILITSIDKDGGMNGYDLELISEVVNTVNVPVIASGGAGNYQHMVDAVNISGASAVAAASMFHFTELTPAGAKQALSKAGIPVRRSYILS